MGSMDTFPALTAASELKDCATKYRKGYKVTKSTKIINIVFKTLNTFTPIFIFPPFYQSEVSVSFFDRKFAPLTSISPKTPSKSPTAAA